MFKVVIDVGKNFQIEEVKIGDMLENFFYTVSEFQRPYAWRKEQQSDLIKDIVDSLAKNRNNGHFDFSIQNFF